jgi:hypothetical protein
MMDEWEGEREEGRGRNARIDEGMDGAIPSAPISKSNIPFSLFHFFLFAIGAFTSALIFIGGKCPLPFANRTFLLSPCIT